MQPCILFHAYFIQKMIVWIKESVIINTMCAYSDNATISCRKWRKSE